jgi:uncharacterized protein (TIGR02271 family)
VNSETKEHIVEHSHSHSYNNLKRLSQLPDYTIESGDPDPRGWKVSVQDGRHVGTVVDLAIDEDARKVRYLIVEPDSGASHPDLRSGATALVRAEDAELDPSARTVMARGFASDTAREFAGYEDDEIESIDTREERAGYSGEQRRITRSEEELRIGKREVERGEARVGKYVETEHVREPVTRRREEVTIERRPVEAGARASAIGEEEIRVPLKEEELVVEKRPVVKEELVIGKRVVEDRDVVEADVRREEFDIDPDTSSEGALRDDRARRNR